MKINTRRKGEERENPRKLFSQGNKNKQLKY
jgi:hypothetical protein